jgi:hypothetical protein
MLPGQSLIRISGLDQHFWMGAVWAEVPCVLAFGVDVSGLQLWLAVPPAPLAVLLVSVLPPLDWPDVEPDVPDVPAEPPLVPDPDEAPAPLALPEPALPEPEPPEPEPPEPEPDCAKADPARPTDRMATVKSLFMMMLPPSAGSFCKPSGSPTAWRRNCFRKNNGCSEPEGKRRASAGRKQFWQAGERKMVPLAGLEPATPSLRMMCSTT